MVLSLLLACGLQGDDFVEAPDTSYRGRPELQAVSASCDDGIIEFRARTIGWSNLAFVDVWMTDRVPDQYEAWEVPTVAFTRDETCDFMVVQLNARKAKQPDPERDDSHLRCSQFGTNNLTFLFQVWYEEGCAGAQVFGADPDSVYTNAMNDGPTESPSNGSCVPEDASETMGIVMDEVPPCSEPLE